MVAICSRCVGGVAADPFDRVRGRAVAYYREVAAPGRIGLLGFIDGLLQLPEPVGLGGHHCNFAPGGLGLAACLARPGRGRMPA